MSCFTSTLAHFITTLHIIRHVGIKKIMIQILVFTGTTDAVLYKF